MWVFTKVGFFSIVRADPGPDGEELVMVRARVLTDLERLSAFASELGTDLGSIHAWPGRDYPYRLIVGRDTWAELLHDLAAAIDYPNFKAEVSRGDGPSRARLYGQVWSVMFDAEHKI